MLSNQIVPDDVTSFYDIDNDANSDQLAAKSGDLITVITWRSRMGTAFAKGQNKRTGEVGYFPTSQGKPIILRVDCKAFRKNCIRSFPGGEISIWEGLTD